MTESDTTIQKKHGRPIYFLGALVLCLSPFLLAGSAKPTLLDRITDSGILTILSSNGPNTYYEGPYGYTGFEYELAEAFAEELGVELVVNDEPSLNDLLKHVGSPEGQFAAYGLSITDSREDQLRFSVPYMEVKQHVIYRRGSFRPRSIEDLADLDIVVISGSSHVDLLKQLKEEVPNIQWRELEGMEQLEMLELVHSEQADITIVDSTAFKLNRNIYPRARQAFTLDDTEEVAWAFPRKGDDSLYKAANRFLEDFSESGELEKLQKKYFANSQLDEGGALTLSRHIETRLPRWEEMFKESAAEHGLDWLFLAAMSYQESHWNSKARSFTGVRGLMMLTLTTAKAVGVTNRLDPKQSIEGGTKYFMRVYNRIPERIQDPDRLWMALAAYNIGFGHLEDARILTESQGGDPDKWVDVKERLPLLSKKKYYKNTRHGYARGWEPVRYVENIHNFYNILVWHNETQQRKLAQELQNEIEPVNMNRIKRGSLSQL